MPEKVGLDVKYSVDNWPHEAQQRITAQCPKLPYNMDGIIKAFMDLTDPKK